MKNEVAYVSTDMVEPSERTEFWRGVTKQIYDITPLRENEQLRASIKPARLDSLVLAELTFNAQRYLRTPHAIARSGLDDYLVQIVVSGPPVGEFGDTRERIEVGDIFFVDLAQATYIETQAGRRLTIGVPRHPLEEMVGRKNLHGLRLKSQSPITMLLRDYLFGLYAVAPRLDGHASVAARDALLTLFSGAIAGENTATPEVQSALQTALRDRVLMFISQQLHDPALGPELLMRRFKVSRSYLYKIFEADGGIAKVIREQRLDLARKKLASTEPQAVSIKRLAFECGFSSSEHFIRLFKSRFGITPAALKTEGVVLAHDESLLKYYHDTLLAHAVPAKNA